MKQYKKTTRPFDFVCSITCNKCGKIVDLENDDFASSNLMHEFHLNFNYESYLDGGTIDFDLCEKCLIQFTESFLIPIDKG